MKKKKKVEADAQGKIKAIRRKAAKGQLLLMRKLRSIWGSRP